MVKSTTGDRVYQFGRNADGTLNHVIDPENNMTAFHYHLSLSNPVRTGLLHKVIDANLNETKYGDPATGDRGYDRSGSPKLIIDARGNPASYIYDFLGRPGQTTDREGKLWKDNYDLRGNLRSSEDPDHSFVRYCYDQNDNLTLIVPPRSPQAPNCSVSGIDPALNGEEGHSTNSLTTPETYLNHPRASRRQPKLFPSRESNGGSSTTSSTAS
jgi:YD repeat-containing protein